MGRIVNSVQLVGNIGEEPVVKYFDSGRAKARFSMATNEVYRDRDGNKQTHVEWHRIDAWDNIAKLIEQFCHKGTKIIVEGKMRTESYQDKEGRTIYKTFVLAEEFLLLSPNPGQEEE